MTIINKIWIVCLITLRGVRCYVLFLWVAITILLIGTDSSRTGKAIKA